MKNYRIVKIGEQYRANFIVQERWLFVFWVTIQNMIGFDLTFNNPEEAAQFIQRREARTKSEIVGYL